MLDALSTLVHALEKVEPHYLSWTLIGSILAYRLPDLVKELFIGIRGLLRNRPRRRRI
jgi:hypothetical protein